MMMIIIKLELQLHSRYILSIDGRIALAQSIVWRLTIHRMV